MKAGYTYQKKRGTRVVLINDTYQSLGCVGAYGRYIDTGEQVNIRKADWPKWVRVKLVRNHGSEEWDNGFYEVEIME